MLWVPRDIWDHLSFSSLEAWEKFSNSAFLDSQTETP